MVTNVMSIYQRRESLIESQLKFNLIIARCLFLIMHRNILNILKPYSKTIFKYVV